VARNGCCDGNQAASKHTMHCGSAVNLQHPRLHTAHTPRIIQPSCLTSAVPCMPAWLHARHVSCHMQVHQLGAVPIAPGSQDGVLSTPQGQQLQQLLSTKRQSHIRHPQQDAGEQLLQQLQHGSTSVSSRVPAWQLLAWARLAVAREAMQHNHTLLLAQLDTVYFKDTLRCVAVGHKCLDLAPPCALGVAQWLRQCNGR
jgi:hypothetical protein